MSSSCEGGEPTALRNGAAWTRLHGIIQFLPSREVAILLHDQTSLPEMVFR